jgi:Domain of unknown function (DUF4190)
VTNQPSPPYVQPPQGQYSPDGHWWWNGVQWVPVAQPPGWYAPAARKANTMAVASLVLSILWLGGLGSLLAVIFGISGRKQIERSQGQENGEGLAIAGLIVGILGLLWTAFFIAVIIGVHHAANTGLPE